jgi:uncharacterized protein
MTTVKLRPVRLALLPSLLLAGGVICAAAPAHAQGFDCRYAATPDEKMICRDPRLGRLDEQLGSAYAREYYDVPGSERGRLDQQEDAWVVSRHRCGADAACIEQSYRRRIEELGGPPRSERDIVGQPRQDAAPARDQDPAVRAEQRDLARPEQAVRSEEDVEVIEEDVEKPRHHHRRTAAPASRAGKPPTRAEATRALRAAKEEPRREQHASDHVEPAKNAAAAEPAPENPAPPSGEHEAVAKKEASAHRSGQHSGAGKPRSTEKASRTAASPSAAPMPPQSGGGSGHGSAEAGKNNSPPAGSGPSISWVNPPPASGK